MKKIFRTIIICCFIAAAAFTLASCSKNKPALNAPQNFALNDGILTWNSIENSEGYTVNINGSNIEANANSLNTAGLNTGSYSLKIKAIGSENFLDSGWSQTVTIDKLAAPENIAVEKDDTLIWTASEGANGYYVRVLDSAENELVKIDVNEINQHEIIRSKIQESPIISVKINNLDLGNYIIIIIPYGGSEFNISNPAIAEYNRSMFEAASLSPSNSQENINLRVDFKFREDFIFDYYNFTSSIEEQQAAEYYQMYHDFFEGTQTEKTAAINKIGNDLIIQYYYFDRYDKIVLATKTKAWEGYLNSYTDLSQNPPSDVHKIEGYYIGQIFGKDNYYTSSYNNPDVEALRGKEIFTDLIVITDNTVFTETFSYVVR